MNTNLITPVLLSGICSMAFAAPETFQAFEGDGYGTWKVKGNAFGQAPTAGGRKELSNKITNYAQESFAESNAVGLSGKGSLSSPAFTINSAYITFLLGGTKDDKNVMIQLWVDNKLTERTTGNNNQSLERVTWSTRAHIGKKAQIKIIDNSKKGYILVDHILFTNATKVRFPRPTRNGVVFNVGMKASKALPNIQIPSNASLGVFANAKNNGVTAPTALTLDEQGNVYVAETWRFKDDWGVDDNRRRRHWILEDLSLQTTADRLEMYKRWYHKHPETNYTQRAEKIRLLKDTDSDGKADKSLIFADDFNDHLDGTAAGVMAFNDTVYFACIPHIWALKDKNGDGEVTRDERKSIQEGFGVRVSFSGHDLNGFAFGPDGRIYATVGDRGFNIKTKEGKHYPYPDQGAILRFDPDGSNMEVVHIGLRNPKEIAFDQWGNAISVDNNSDQGDQARVVYMMEGGDSGWRMGHQILHSFHRTAGLEKRPINRWMQEQMWKPQNPAQPAYILPPLLNLTSGPSGLTYDPGTTGFAQFQNQFLICDYRGSSTHSGITGFGIAEDGAGMKVTSPQKFNWGVAATDIEYGYDGKIYVSDFIGGWSTHKNGRVYSLTPEKITDGAQSAKELIAGGIHKMHSTALVTLLEHPDMRVRLRAQFALTKQTDALQQLEGVLNDKVAPQLKRLHAVWGLGMLARLDRSELATQILIQALTDMDYRIRGQAAKCLGESTLKSGDKLLPLLNDKSKRVRAFAALSLGRLKTSSNTSILAELDANNNKDVYYRHALVMALYNNSTPDTLVSLAGHQSHAVRLGAVLTLRKHESPLLTRFLSDSNTRVRDAAIRAIHDREIKQAQPEIANLLNGFVSNVETAKSLTPMMQRRLIHAAFRVGGAVNAERLIAIAGAKHFDMNQRLEALRLISLWEQPPVVDQSMGRYSPLQKRNLTPVIILLENKLAELMKSDAPIIREALRLTQSMKVKPKGVDATLLSQLASNTKLDTQMRAESLNTLAKLDNKAAQKVASQLVREKNATIAGAALSTLASGDIKAATAEVINATKAPVPSLRQKAWMILKKIDNDTVNTYLVDCLSKLSTADADQFTALEILELAESRKANASVRKALSNYQASYKGNLTKEWATTLMGGDITRGKAIYASHGSAQCMRCHTLGYDHEAGGNAGPNLAGIATLGGRGYILESLILPHARVATGFGSITVTLKNKQTVTGVLMQEAKQHIMLQAGKTTWKIKRSDIVSTTTPMSAMPAMNAVLSKREMRDLVEYLAQQKQKRRPIELGNVKELDPSTIKPAPADNNSGKFNLAKSIKAGEAVYKQVCVACHQANGEGIHAAQLPPLAGSEWVNGNKDNAIRIQLRGLMGPIKVKGKEYNGVMPPNAALTDAQIANVLNYIRNSWGNKNNAVLPTDVKAHRGEVGKPILKAQDLIDPNKK